MPIRQGDEDELESRVSVTERSKLIASIALDFLEIRSLKPRGRDRDDFHSLAVWSIENALGAAYDAGVIAAGSGRL